MVRVFKRMHRHVFDGQNIDLVQVIKDVYFNFHLIFTATISDYKSLETSGYILYESEFVELRKELGFSITFTRCMLRRFADEGSKAIDTSLVDILTDVESHFVDLLERCSRALTRGGISIVGEQQFLSMGSLQHMFSRMSNAFVVVFSTSTDDSLSSSSSTSLMQSDETMVEYLDELVEILCLQCDDDNEDGNIKSSIKKLEFLRNYIEFTKGYCTNVESWNEFLIRVEGVADSAACYSSLKKCGDLSSLERYLLIKNRVELEIGIAVLRLQASTDQLPPLTNGLMKVYVDCVREVLTKLINNELTSQLKNLLDDLHKDLELLAGSIQDNPIEVEKLLDVTTVYQTLACNVGSVLFLFLNEETTGSRATETSTRDKWQDFLEKAHLLRKLVNHVCWLISLDRIGQNSPHTYQLGFLTSFIDDLRELNDFNLFLKNSETGEFEGIDKDLVLLRSYLQNMTMGNNSTADYADESDDLLNRIRCSAYEAEHFVNSHVAGDIPECCRLYWFSEFKQQVKLIKSTFAVTSEKKLASNIDNVDIVATTSNPSRLLPTSDVVVGFEDEMKLIKERLISDSEKLDVISIIGMAGLGKTTFARKIYDDPSIVDQFQLRAWCSVSQEYNNKELVLTILGCLTKLTPDAYRRREGDLSKTLYQQLTGSRYLIFLDDVWGMDAMKYLKRFFPDNRNGSRIMLTSRNRLEDYRDPFELPLLTHEQSWKLLKHKVYQNEECPEHLSQLGEEIAEKCKGLPLSIVVVGGILAKSEKRRDFWEQVAGNLSSYIAGDTTQAQVMAVLELSYKFLPDHLKPLFLYLGAFPEDTEIPANKLGWLWIAEGFVHKTDQTSTTLEVQAELNLMDLIDRSLVMIAERRSNGRVKSCRVHDLLRDMCLVKAKDENFMRLVNVNNADSRSYVTYERRLSISLTRGAGLYLRHEKTFFSTCKGLSKGPDAPPLSSFLFFNMNKTLPLSDEDIIAIFRDFRLMKILHAESITVDENIYENYVVKLVHMRYISIRAGGKSVPRSIYKVRNLETLIIQGLGGEIAVPEEIWTLVKLRHLHINYRANFSRALLHDRSSKLENLQTLSTPVVCSGDENKLIRKVPNLRKLRFISVEAKNSHGNFEYQLPQLESLDRLESLKIICDSRMRCKSGHFGLPSTLKKLTLSKFRIQWSEISNFHKLPNLEVLKLRGGTFEDASWDMGDVEFSKLVYLKLESLNVKKWIVSPDNFPRLKKLVLQSCKKLEDIPSSVGDFNSLEKIEVLWCSTSAVDSAKQIQEEQKDMGNELLDVQIRVSS